MEPVPKPSHRRSPKAPPSPYAGATDPASLLLVQIIKQAIDDFGLAARTKRRLASAANLRAQKTARRLTREAEDAREFLFSPYGYRLERLLKVAAIPPEVISLKRVRKMAIEGCTGNRPAFENFVGLAKTGEPEAEP